MIAAELVCRRLESWKSCRRPVEVRGVSFHNWKACGRSHKLQRVGFDYRKAFALSNRRLTLASCYRLHEREKRSEYDQRVREIEHGTFTPLVFSAAGGMGTAATVTYKRLASLLATKQSQPYSRTMG